MRESTSISDRIGYLGGSFDPPHLGHLAMAEAALRTCHLDRVLFAPTGLQPFKRHGASASFEHRLAMIRLLCAADPTHLEVSRIDGPSPDGQPNYTADTLARLQAAHPAAHLFAILGADSFRDLPTWRQPDRLLSLADWIVISRPGHPLPDPLLPPPLPTGRVHPVTDVAIPLASSDLRPRLQAGDPCADAIPPAVLEYIRKNALYTA